MRTPQAGDYIKTVSDRFNAQWRGKIRRASDMGNGMYLIEWSDCGSLPIDICTWVFDTDIVIVRRPKAKLEVGLN